MSIGGGISIFSLINNPADVPRVPTPVGTLAPVSDAAVSGAAATGWPAPVAAGAVAATVVVPGSKSETNRALVIAALADSPTRVTGPLQARDTTLMAQAVQALGVDVEMPATGCDAATTWTVAAKPLTGGTTVDCGLAGTVMRFVPPLAALAEGPVTFDGDARARERPMGPMLAALRDLHVPVTTGGTDALPFTVHGAGRVGGGALSIESGSSSQFVSGLLLVGCAFDDGLRLDAVGSVPSTPHIEMTLAMLRGAGVAARTTGTGSWLVEPGRPRGGTIDVAPDLSNAAPFLAAALLTGGTVRVPGWATAASQPGRQILDVFHALGATSHLVGDDLVLEGRGAVTGVDLDLRDVPELVTTVAVLAAVADAPSTIRGAAHVRGHETDRLAALADELNALGGDVHQRPDGLRIRPTPLHGGTFHTYADHRLATAAAVLGLVVPHIVVQDVATTSKTLPDFTTLWTDMLAGSTA